MRLAHLDKTGGILPCKVGDDKAFGNGRIEVTQAGLDEFHDGALGPSRFRLIRPLIDVQRLLGLQRIVDGEQGQTGSQQLPEGLDRAIIPILLLVLQLF